MNFKQIRSRKKAQSLKGVSFSSLLIAFFLFIPYISAEVTLGTSQFDNNVVEIEVPHQQVNYSLVSVNNSILWNGFEWDIDRWLLIDGSNANQDIDINDYDLTTGDLYARNINATNITTENINVTKNSTIWIGGVPISSATTFNGDNVVTFGNAFVNATGYFGDGGYLENISFINGTVIANAFNGSNFFGGNFFADLYNLNGTNITDWSDVNYTVGNSTVSIVSPLFSGSYGYVTPSKIDYEIAQIIVEPLNAGTYRFEMSELVSGDIIDKDRKVHNSEWNIYKSHILNDQVVINFTNVAPANQFNITIKYLTNVQSP